MTLKMPTLEELTRPKRRRKRYVPPETGRYYAVASSVPAGETNCCGPITLAILAGVPFENAQVAFAAGGRCAREKVTDRQIFDAASRLGLQLEEVKKGRLTDARTVITLEKLLYPTDRLLVLVTGHVFAVVEGKIEDWTVGRAKRIREIYKVTS